MSRDWAAIARRVIAYGVARLDRSPSQGRAIVFEGGAGSEAGANVSETRAIPPLAKGRAGWGSVRIELCPGRSPPDPWLTSRATLPFARGGIRAAFSRIDGRLLAAAVALPLACGPATAVEIETARGPVAVEATPQRVAVYDVAAVDTLLKLGVAPAGVPEKLFVPELEKAAAGAERVGTLFEPDLEALSALGPDLVVVGGRSSPRAAATARLAQTIDMTIDGADLVGDARKRLAAYGALFGKTAEAAALAKDLDAALDRARAAATGKGAALILMTNGPKITAYGPASRFGWLHRELGLPPAADVEKTGPHGEAVSFEFVAKANPDWLIVVDRASALNSSEQNARATLDNQLVAGTTAWRKGQVIFLPAADLYIAAGGVQATERVLAALTDAFAKAR